MITVKTAEGYLKNKIGDMTEVDKIWEVFKSFGREVVQGEEEIALLFQCGIYDFTGEEFFYFDFVRQFAGREQLHCEFIFTPTDTLRKLEASEWYFDSDGDVDGFYTMVESMEEFTIPLSDVSVERKIYQEKI